MLKPKEFAEGLAHHALSRREVAATLAGAGLGMAVMPMASRHARADPNLSIFEWSGMELPDFHPEYTARYGGEPQYTFLAEEEAALQKLRSGFTVDLSHPCTASTRRWRDAGVIRPIDTARIARWGDIIPELFKPNGVLVDGVPFLMPWDFGFSQIVYNPAIIPLDNPSFDVLVDPQFERKVSMNAQFDVALAVGGVIAGNQNIFDPTEEETARLVEVWRRMIKTSRFLWSDGTEITQAMASGEVGAAYMWTSGIVELRQQGLDIRVIDPVMPWLCGLCLNADHPGSEEQAYDYLNAVLDPAGGKALIESYYIGHANAKSYELVDHATLVEYGLDEPAAALRRGLFFDEVPPEKRDKLINLWDEVQAGG